MSLQKTKLQLEIEKLKKEKENQDLYNFILNNKLMQLQSEGKIKCTSIDEYFFMTDLTGFVFIYL